MSKRIGDRAAPVVLATVILLSAHVAARAEGCIEEPTSVPPEGRHWYYHFDQANNRRCWHLGEAGLAVRPAMPPAPEGADRDARQASALSKAKRDALFQDFVRWNELQRAAR